MAFGREAVDAKYVREIAEKLYKYQNFKGAVIPNYVKSEAYSDGTVKSFHSLLRAYVKAGNKNLKKVSNEFYDTIDRLKQVHCSILRPSEAEQARAYGERDFSKHRANKNINVTKIEPVAKAPEKINISAETMEKVKVTPKNMLVALKCENKFITFKNEDEMNGYIMAYSEIDDSLTFEKVKLVVETI